jgi:hypothetical protein
MVGDGVNDAPRSDGGYRWSRDGRWYRRCARECKRCSHWQ